DPRSSILDPRSSRQMSLVVGRWSFVRLRWLALVAAVVAYLAWLRFGRPYEYGYMKGGAYAGVVAWGLGALGWQALRARLGDRPTTNDQRPTTNDQRPRGDKETRRQGDYGLRTTDYGLKKEHATRDTQQISQFSILNSQFLALALGLAPLL